VRPIIAVAGESRQTVAWYPKVDDDVSLDEDLAESLRHRHQELYGTLLEIHEQVNDCGTLTFGTYSVVLMMAYAALWSGLYQHIPALQGLALNNFWTYAALFFAAWFAYTGHRRLIERGRYGRHRFGVQDLAGKAGLTRHQLMARLEGDPAVKQALAMIKRDRWESGIGSFHALGG
jgi:hypothetical protein